MAEATKLKSLPGEAEKRTARQAKKDRYEAFDDKTFEQLTNPQKDRLLKNIAISMGLILDSAD